MFLFFLIILVELLVFIMIVFVMIVLLLVLLGWDILGMVGIFFCVMGIRVMMVG